MTSHRSYGIITLNLVAIYSKARQVCGSITAQNTGILIAEVKNHINVSIVVNILQRITVGYSFITACPKVNGSPINCAGVEIVSG